MKVPPPPSYDETIETEPINNSNIYPTIPESKNQQFQQPLIGVQQNINVLNPQSNPHVNQVLGLCSQPVYCPTCKQHTMTKIKYISGFYTWTLVLLCIIFGGILCCYIPFCVNSFKDCQHFCTQCNNYIGTFQRSSSRDDKKRSIIVFCLCLSLFLFVYYFNYIYTPVEIQP